MPRTGKKLLTVKLEQTTTAIAVLIGLTLLNVWLLRIDRPTNYRGGNAKTMRDEFRLYGLPDSVFYIVGVLKIGSVWQPQFLQPAAIVLSVLMLCTVGMHLRVSDPLQKAIPALFLFCLSLFLVIAESV